MQIMEFAKGDLLPHLNAGMDEYGTHKYALMLVSELSVLMAVAEIPLDTPVHKVGGLILQVYEKNHGSLDGVEELKES